jgi:hypothetical protein
MSPKFSLDQPATYCIRVQGKLDARWAAYFEELVIQNESDPDGTPITVLTGCLPDQAAVQGVLQKLYNLGFSLLSAEKIPPES